MTGDGGKSEHHVMGGGNINKRRGEGQDEYYAVEQEGEQGERVIV